MAERPQPRGFDVNQPGSTQETFTGLAQGATTDLVGSVVDLGAAATGIASQVDPRLLSVSPKAAVLSYLNPFAEQAQEVAGSEALGQRVFGDAPTEELQKIRDDARLVGGIAGLGEMATAKVAKFVAGGIQDFMRFLPNVRPQAVTPDGQMVPLPDTSVTEMLASTDTPGMNQKYVKGLKTKEANAQKRLEAGEDPRKVFEDTGFMRINVDARPGRGPGFMDSDDSPLKTKMVFDIPDNLSQIKISNILPESVGTKVSAEASAEKIMDSFENLKDPKNFFVERGHRGGEYGRSVQFKLKDVMGEDHPLFDVFPDLRDDIDVRIIEKPSKGSGGHWDDSTNTIAIGAQYLGDDRYTSTLMVHEIAHVLQTRGDLPRGSSPFLVKESVSGKLFDNFALYESLKMIDEPGYTNFNPYEFFNELRPKGEAKNLENLVNKAQFNVKNANPEAPDNLTRMWPGNTNSTAPVNLDEMPYANEVKAEMYRLIAEKEAKAFKEAEAYEALGIDIYREKDAAGSLKQGPSAMGNYMKTRGEFMARLQEGYALATEGMPVSERRMLFPMDVAIKGARATEAAPGGSKGITGGSVAYEKDLAPGTGVMRGTQGMDYPAYLAEIREKEALIASNPEFPLKTRFGLFDDMKELEFSLEMAKEDPKSMGIIPEGRPGINVGTVPPSEMGLVDVEGLINVDKIPENLKKKIEYPKKGPAPAPAPIKLRDDTQPPFTLEDGEFPSYDFTNSAPIDSDNVGGFVSMVDTIHVPTGTRIPAESMVRGHKADFERAPGIPPLDSDTARRLLDGEISLDEARKELVRKNLKVVDKAKGGVITLADAARNTGRGPRGIASLASTARNMNRPMVS